MKGDRRKPTAPQRLAALAAMIPDRATFEDFLTVTPPLLREQVRRELVPYLTFELKESTL